MHWAWGAVHMRVFLGVHSLVCSAAAGPAAGGQKAKAAAWFFSTLSPHGVKPSLQGSHSPAEDSSAGPP